MCFMRRIVAYLCLNMINFDAADFSERRSEEVISFFWRSVYILHFLIPDSYEDFVFYEMH